MSDDAPVEAPDPTVKLSVPIKHGSEMIRELTLTGQPTLGNMKGVRIKVGPDGLDFDIGDVPKIIGPLANIPPSVAAQISLKDLGALVPVVMDFFGVSLED